MKEARKCRCGGPRSKAWLLLVMAQKLRVRIEQSRIISSKNNMQKIPVHAGAFPHCLGTKQRFSFPFSSPRLAAFFDAEGCISAVWEDRGTYKIKLSFWQDNHHYLQLVRDISFAGIPCKIRQCPDRAPLRPGSHTRGCPGWYLLFKEADVRAACARFRPFLQMRYVWPGTSYLRDCKPTPPYTPLRFLCRAAAVDGALAYLDAKDAYDIDAMEDALLVLDNLNATSRHCPLLAHEMPPEHELAAWTHQQFRRYVAAIFDHDGHADLAQWLRDDLLIDAEVRCCHTINSASLAMEG